MREEIDKDYDSVPEYFLTTPYNHTRVKKLIVLLSSTVQAVFPLLMYIQCEKQE